MRTVRSHPIAKGRDKHVVIPGKAIIESPFIVHRASRSCQIMLKCRCHVVAVTVRFTSDSRNPVFEEVADLK